MQKRHRFLSAAAALLILVFSFVCVAQAGSQRAPRARHRARADLKAEFAADLLAQATQVRPMDETERLEAAGHFEGVPLWDIMSFEAKAATNALGVQPGIFRVYNTSSATSRYVMQFRIKARGRAFTQEIPLNLPAGTVIVLTLNRWGPYRARAFADNNADGFRNAGDTLVGKDRFWLVKKWWRKNGTAVRNMVFTGSVTPNPNPNPNPNPGGYPNGAVILLNHLTGKFLVKGSFNGALYAFPSVPFESWGYVTGFYGSVAVSAEFADVAGGATTVTRTNTIAGPANASAAAAVWDINQ